MNITINFKNLFQKSHFFLLACLLALLPLGYGCLYESDNDSSNVVAPVSRQYEISGTISMPASPSLTSPVNRATGFNNGKHFISVVDKDNISSEIGTVAVSGNIYNAVIPFTSLNRYAMLVVKDQTGRTLYKNLLGRLLKTNEIPPYTNIIKISNVKIDENSTAKAAFGLEKGAPDVPIANITSSEYSQPVIYVDCSSGTALDGPLEALAGGANNISQATNAIITLAAVLNSTSLSDTIKNKIAAPASTSKISELLISFVKALNDSSARQIIDTEKLATSVNIDNKSITQSMSESEVTDIITHVMPVDPLNAPVISPNGSTGLSSPLTVTITAAAGSIIRYTTDGTLPSATNGSVYSSALTISSNTVLKAVAIKDGVSSSISAATFSFYQKAATPVISPAGGSYSSVQLVSISTTTAGATIKYTTDGSAPSETNGMIYSGPLTIAVTTTLKAITVKTGMANSDIASENYIINSSETLTAPTFTPTGGSFTTSQTISITTSTTGATIKYTTDGTNPSATNGQTYSGPFSISSTTTIRAVTIKSGVLSAFSTQTYTISSAIAAPVITPSGGSHLPPLEITITCATPGATIFYTDDGSAPTISSYQYNSVQKITINQSKTIKAVAAKASTTTGSVNYSDTATSTFDIMQKAATPYFQPAGGTYNGSQSVTIATATAGASIYYTTNGSEPSTAAAIYSGAIAVNSNMTIKAVAIKAGMANSDAVSAIYVINPADVADPVFDLATGTYNEPKYLSLTCATAGASIYYTTDGSIPSAASNLYNASSKIHISSGEITEVKAIAIKAGMQNSSVVTRSYRIDQNAASCSIQYYSDYAMTASLSDKPYLKAGTYYLKISASKTLKQPPTVTIDSEGGANDVTNAAAALFSGNDYRFVRTIINDTQAVGNIQESISISSIDANGLAAEGIKPTNESAKAAFTDTVAPAANITFNPGFPVKQGVSILIKADLTEEILNTTPLKISLSGVNTLSATSMTKITASQYQYSYTTQAGNGSVNITLSGATDKAGNAITQAPSSGGYFELDNSVPPQPGNIVITPVGGEIRTNTLNSTNTNLTVTANIDSSKTAGGKAELYIGSSTAPVMTDFITSGDLIVFFDLNSSTNTALKNLVPSGGEVKVRLYNKAGGYTDSVANPTLTVDYIPPSAPVIPNTFTAMGGTVFSGKINSTNTNFTATANINAGQATGGKAQLFINNSPVKESQPISSSQSIIDFKVLDIDSPSFLQSAIPAPGGTLKVRLYDGAGNYSESSPVYSVLANYSALTAPTGIVLSPAGGTVVPNTLNSTNTNLTATAAITAEQATGGRAELYIGSVKVAEYTNIAATDGSITFNCGAVAEADLQSKISAGGLASVKLYDAYGNTVTSTGGPTLTVKYTRPADPSGIVVTPVGGTVVVDRLNSSNTNLTATATITAGTATGGKAELYVGPYLVASDLTIAAPDTSVDFDCLTATPAALKDKIPYGGIVLVKLYDAYGNYSQKAGNTLSVDYTSQPLPPQASKLYFNGAEKKVYFEADINGSPNDGSTDATRKLTLYLKVTRGIQPTIYKYNNGFANNSAGSFAFSVGTGATQFTRVSGDDLDSSFPMAGDALEYAVTDSYGNMSTYTADGAIPIAPDASATGLDNRDGKINVGGTAITSLAGISAIYVYYANDFAGSSLTLHNYTILGVTHDGINTTYEATAKAAWEPITAGKNLAYAIMDTLSGNISTLTYDGTVPAPPDITQIGYSRAAQKSTITFQGLMAINDFGAVISMWMVDNANNENPILKGTKVRADILAPSMTEPNDLITAQTIDNPKYIAYTITDSYGNISTFANDGQVPLAPVGANITWSDATSKFKVRNDTFGSADTHLGVHKKNTVTYTYNLGRATIPGPYLFDNYTEYPAKKTDNSSITVWNADGDEVAYTLINNSGNESAYADGGLVPAKPDVTKLAYSKVTKKTTVSAGAVLAAAGLGTLYCWQADDATGTTVLPKGSNPNVNSVYGGDLQADQDIAENKYILYSFKNSAGNTSAYANDGQVPVAPTQAAVTASSFSNASGAITINGFAFTALDTNTKINVYEDENGAYDSVNTLKKNWTALAVNNQTTGLKFATISGGSWSPIDASTKPFVGYSIETAENNESLIVFDTNQIPAAPSLPIATTLIPLGDGGMDAPAGYVNDAGKASVTLRPGILLSTGEKVTLKVNKTNSAIMTATASAAVTPVFGIAEANVTFTNVNTNSGNTTTGKFDFTVGGGVSPVIEGTDVAVTATKTAANGNESAWSATVNITYDKTAPTLSFSQASYTFVNVAGAKLFTLTANETIRANSDGLPLAGIHSTQYIKTFAVAGWTANPLQFKIDDFVQGTAITITSDASANDTETVGRTKPTAIELGTAGMAFFKDLAGNKLTNAVVTVNP